MYERFVNQLKEYLHAIRILSKGYLPISVLPPSKLVRILQEVKQVLLKTNINYGLVIKGMYKYYDIDKGKEKYKVQTRSQTKASRVKLPEVHGSRKRLDPHIKYQKNNLSQ